MAITARTACHSIASAWQSAITHPQCQTNSAGIEVGFPFCSLRDSAASSTLPAARSVSVNRFPRTAVAKPTSLLSRLQTFAVPASSSRWGQGPGLHRFPATGAAAPSRPKKVASCFYARRNAASAIRDSGVTMNESVLRRRAIEVHLMGGPRSRPTAVGIVFPAGTKLLSRRGWESFF
jgi:hypothetical protein